jgi:hypothetical protein
MISSRQVDITVDTALPSLSCKLGCPDAAEKILTFVLILRIELNVLVVLVWYHTVVFFIHTLIPLCTLDDPLRLEYELADLVFLTVLGCIDILPSQHTTTATAADVRYSMGARHELTSMSLVCQCVWQITFLPSCRRHIPTSQKA